MRDYSEGKIYQILNTVTDDVYIGSTTQTLSNRMKNHRSDGKKRLCHLKIYQAFSKHGVDEFYIELIEKYPCECKEELTAREGFHIRQKKPSFNSRIAGRFNAEYFQDNREHLIEKQKNTPLIIKKRYCTKTKCIG